MKRRRRSATPQRARTPRPAAVDKLRAICLALPDTTEKLAWSEPTWRVRGKLFAQLDNHHHGADHLAFWCPAPPGVQQEMVEQEPSRFFRPPYVGVRGWLGVRIDDEPDWDEVARIIEDAYRMVAPKKLVARLD